MLVDLHTNLCWYPDHLSDEFVEFGLAAKKAKMRMTPDVYFANSSEPAKNAFDSTPESLLKATANCDKVVVLGLKAPFCGINVPQEIIRDFVQARPDHYVGWCSVDPNDPDCINQLVHYVRDWGMRGLKVAPIYQNWNPQDPKHLPLFKQAEQLGIPINIHQGTSFVRPGPLKYANPILLEDIAIACPELRMIISHLGHPWETECIVLIRKHPHLYANVSALHYRPLRFYQAMMTAFEYGVEHKLVFGSDFPSATPEQVMAGLRNVNAVVQGTGMPHFPPEAIERIIYDNWRQVVSFD
jgi:predicted TIM-barrel fold metal-dependent hydrolase